MILQTIHVEHSGKVVLILDISIFEKKKSREDADTPAVHSPSTLD